MTTKSIFYPQEWKVSKKTRINLIKTLVIGMSIFAAWMFRTPIKEALVFMSDREGLIAYLGDYDGVGAVLLFVILFLQVIVAAIPGHVFMLTGGYLYGFVAGFLLIHTSTVIASQLSYWLARKYGRPVVEKFAPPQLLDKWTEKAERQGIVFFFFSFNLPIFPSDVMNFVAGLSGLSPKKFFIANFTGRLPGAIIFALVGARGFQVSPVLAAVAGVFTLAMFIAWIKLSPKFEAQQANNALAGDQS